MAFIEEADYKVKIREARLMQVIEEDPDLLDVAEETAIQVVRDALHSRYDVAAIFATTAGSRPKQVVRWVMCLAIYYLYERIPDKLTPERVVKNYNDTLTTLNDISDGKLSTELPRLANADSTNPTKFRWGSQPARTH